ncbi:hypothetical protein WICMUC_001603 [Wickerhamomyces mucosus]|uniref:Wbp11/ELF5/Saf1 N-terminal domain-containing protein n=1 Tax=Wickerhamomyces mucosus TaxID=1378264 RepID=A0A9P8PVR5_9ASCO|nr:hypothetical protein WICMUC_001603 [Wickerhamomyces mucosus]
MSDLLHLEKLKKFKEQRAKERLERLKTLDPQRLQTRVNDLRVKKENNNGRLIHNEQRLLQNLEKDLESITKHNLNTNNEAEDGDLQQEQEISEVKLGRKSVFYDPEWNPIGLPPKGFTNLEYNSIIHNTEYDALDIPLPSEPQPKFYKLRQFETTYEAEANIKPLKTANFVPSIVRQKRKLGDI